ncbi:MAG: uroporphyrinogen decarboxylase family protein [Bacillota bacterium]
MTNRERFIKTVLCEKVDRLPFIKHFGPWEETLKNWRTQGLGEQSDWGEGFGFDLGITTVNVNLGYFPAFEYEFISETTETVTYIDYMGIKKETRKDGCSMPRFIDYPIKNREDWERVKRERLNSNDPQRFPENWSELVKSYNSGDIVVQLGDFPYGLFGTLRDMMGVEEFLVSLYEEPELIKEMMDYLTDFWLEIYAKVCKDVKVDVIHIWEDMSGKQGSLISPAMIREFMLPNYKKIKAFAQAQNIPVFSMDTDGNCSELVPLFMEGGINLMLPFEVAAGSDIVDFRRKYPSLGILGGIDKQEIAKGKVAIDRELDRIQEMFQSSGYIPALDHLAHPDISWNDYCYYIEKLKERIGV